MGNIKLIKYIGLGLSVAGTLITAWVTTKENESVLEKTVEKYMKKHNM